MGEKYHTGRAAGVSPLVVVVSEKILSLHPFTEIPSFQCILGFILRRAREEGNMRPQQRGQGFP